MPDTGTPLVDSVVDPTPPAAAPAQGAPGTGRRDRWAPGLWGVFVVGALLRLATAALPERLLLRVTIDDALYYTGVARHFGRGHGFSMDGIHATNGFHPLWALLVTPLTWIAEGTALVRSVALLQALLGAAAFVLLARLLRPLLGTLATTVGLAIWWLSPHSLLHGQSGVEAALVTLCVALLWTAAVSYDRRPSPRLAAAVGLASGACFLARSDVAFAVLATGLWLVVRQLRSGSDRAVLARNTALAGGTAAAVVAPWWLWNLAAFSTLSQDSFWARPQVEWQLATGASAPTAPAALDAAVGYLSDGWLLETGWPPLAALCAAACAAALTVRLGFARGWSRHLAALGAALLVAGTVLAAIHGGLRMLPRGYYFEWVRMSLGLFTAAVVAGLVSGPARAALAERVGGDGLRRIALGTVAAVLVLGTLLGLRGLTEPGYPWQGHMVAAGRWVHEHTDPDDVVLAFNSGILTEYSGRTVVNVDGVINHDAAAAIEERALARYLCGTGATWLVDFSPVVLEDYEPFMGDWADRLELERVAVIEDPGAQPYGRSSMTAYRFGCRD